VCCETHPASVFTEAPFSSSVPAYFISKRIKSRNEFLPTTGNKKPANNRLAGFAHVDFFICGEGGINAFPTNVCISMLAEMYRLLEKF